MIKSDNRRVIAVCGGVDISHAIYQMVVELGGLLAEAGYMVACGGLGGTMEAVAKGAKEHGGFTLGFIPSYNRADANSFIDLVIPTGMGEARNTLLVVTADAIVTVAGGAGTLNEISLGWKFNKPIIALMATGGWSARLGGTQIDSTRNDRIYNAQSPEDALEILKSLFG
ncbi:MAG: TIGR00725 family protein [Promethearchaeota archaeon]